MKQALYTLCLSLYVLLNINAHAKNYIEYDMRSTESGWARVVDDTLTGKAVGKNILFKILNIGRSVPSQQMVTSLGHKNPGLGYHLDG